MGQPIVVNEQPSVANPGMVRFETNRALTGMGHERYTSRESASGDRPPDEVARRLFDHGGVAAVHVNGNVITVDLLKGHSSEGMLEVIEGLYTFYGEPTEAPVAPEGEAVEADQADAPTADAAPAEAGDTTPAD